MNLPIPSGWRLYFADLYHRLYRQITSPWTKITVLALLAIVVTRKEFSFSLSIDGGRWLGLQQSSVFQSPSPGTEGRFTLFGGGAPAREWSQRELEQLDYVRRYKDIALRQMEEQGIPASITLAQGLLESGVGQSTLAVKNNNHFGLKCFSKNCSKGHCSNHSDDHHKDFFRIFSNPEESYRAHGELLQKDRYQGLFRLDRTDYRSWARGLSEAGYATDPKYADKLIRMIESLELFRLDA